MQFEILHQVQQIGNPLILYMSNLDWSYILTFIIIAYAINTLWKKQKKNDSKKKSHKRYRTALIGIVYAVVLFFIRGYELFKIETLFQSFVFALAFHKMIIEGIMHYITRTFFPPNINSPSGSSYYKRHHNPPTCHD